MSSVPNQLAETIQVAHIKRHPDARHDLAPATAADAKESVFLYDSANRESADDGEEDGGDYIPISLLQPTPRKQTLPPLPDLRFEQSYLRSIAAANTWWKVLLITARDQVSLIGEQDKMSTDTKASQVLLPLTQGLVWNLLLCGFQFWNQSARVHGNTVGARVRRWWYGVNKWALPKELPPT